MKSDFKEIMAKRSDAELIEILTKKQDEYQHEALEAAKSELESRNLSTEKIRSAEQEIESKEKAVAENANLPLETTWKILTFVFPGIPNFLIARAIKAEGYERKWKEAWRWTFYGFGFYIALFLLALLLVRL